jgi:integrase
MAWARKLPSGKWQGIATHPNGRKSTKTWPLKRQAVDWAEEQEATWRRDRSYDPRAGEITVGEWLDVWAAARRVERTTAAKDSSYLRNHIRPYWGTWPLSSITRLDVAAWVAELERKGVGGPGIGTAVRLFRTALQGAVDSGRLLSNPAARVALPKLPPGVPRFFTEAEADLITAQLPHPWDVACRMNMRVGLRPGELLGLKVGAVDWERASLSVRGVLTPYGWRAHAKSARSHRTVPIPHDLLDSLAPLVLGRPDDAPVFAAPRGGFQNGTDFRRLIWAPAVWRAGLCPAHVDLPRPVKGRDEREVADVRDRIAGCGDCHQVLQESPHTMRHTAASWLVMAGVDLYRVQALLGHSSQTMTERYSHLAPSAHDRIRAAWTRTHEEPHPSE